MSIARTGRHRESKGRRDHEHDAREHHGESGDAHDGLADDDADDQKCEPDAESQRSEDDRGGVGSPSSRADGRDVIGLIVVEAALHLVEEALLLLRKRHIELLQASGACGVMPVNRL